MSCGCEMKRILSELCRVSELARKAAILDKCIYVVYLKSDGTYTFEMEGQEITGEIVEYRHYL